MGILGLRVDATKERSRTHNRAAGKTLCLGGYRFVPEVVPDGALVRADFSQNLWNSEATPYHCTNSASCAVGERNQHDEGRHEREDDGINT